MTVLAELRRVWLPVLGAGLLSIVLYIVCFAFVISRPLTVDILGEMMRIKTDYARKAGTPKIVIIAGSNARFSHSCALIETILGRPCANGGIHAEVSLDYMFQSFEPTLKAGDLVYLPLEYGALTVSPVAHAAMQDGGYLFRHDRVLLLARQPREVLTTAFRFDFSYMIQGLAEMGFSAAGIARREAAVAIDLHGDALGTEDGSSYAAYLAALPSGQLTVAQVLGRGDETGYTALLPFLAWCRAHGVRVVGGLPTVFDDTVIEPGVINGLRRLYQSVGMDFVVLPTRSQYPRRCFFDTSSHLNAACRAEHSALVADALRPFLEATSDRK